MDKYLNKYRAGTNRADWWDYASAGVYFITVCTKGRVNYFGQISDSKMTLSAIGEIVDKEWQQTFQLRADMNLQMAEYVIMPNHFHAILRIGHNPFNEHSHEPAILSRSGNRFGPQSKNLAAVIKGFKTAVCIKARKVNPDFEWQSRYYDHIIQSEAKYIYIANYIINNPETWAHDRFYFGPKPW